MKLCKASFPPLLPTPVPGSSILALVARKKLSKKDSLPVEKKMGGGSQGELGDMLLFSETGKRKPNGGQVLGFLWNHCH